MADATPAAPSFWRAVGLTFEITVRNARTCLILVAVYAVLNGVANAIGREVSLDIDPARASPGELVAIGAAAIAGLGTLVLVNLLVYPPTIGALSLVGSGEVFGDELEVGGIVRRALDRALEAIGAVVLTFLLLVGVPLVFVGALGALIGIAVGAEAGFAALVVVALFLIPFDFYMFVRLSLAVPIVMRQGLGPVAALRRSWELVGGAWWWVAGLGVLVVLGAGLVSGVISSVASVGPAGSTSFVLSVLGSTAGAAVTGSLFGVLSGVAYAARSIERPPPDLDVPPEQGPPTGVVGGPTPQAGAE